jgi:hypothetical protein
MSTADPGTVREWIAKAEDDIEEMTTQADEIQRRLAQRRIQLGLLYELLASIDGETIPRRIDLVASEKSVRERVVEGAVQILKDQGEPMRIQDIHSEFMRRKFPLPGSGTPTNIAAHLIDRTVFTRPRRGVFGLADWTYEEGSPGMQESTRS